MKILLRSASGYPPHERKRDDIPREDRYLPEKCNSRGDKKEVAARSPCIAAPHRSSSRANSIVNSLFCSAVISQKHTDDRQKQKGHEKWNIDRKSHPDIKLLEKHSTRIDNRLGQCIEKLGKLAPADRKPRKYSSDEHSGVQNVYEKIRRTSQYLKQNIHRKPSKNNAYKKIKRHIEKTAGSHPRFCGCEFYQKILCNQNFYQFEPTIASMLLTSTLLGATTIVVLPTLVITPPTIRVAPER